MEGRQSKTGSRGYSAELKRQVLGECAPPGARIVQVAAAHGLDPNLVDYRRSRAAQAVLRTSAAAPTAATVQIVLLALTDPPATDIRIELRCGATEVRVHWPVTAAGDCAQLLRHRLR
jgi:transposase